MNPEKGLINQALAVVGVDGPGWLTNPNLACSPSPWSMCGRASDWPR